MKAIQVNHAGDSTLLKMTEHPMPVCGADEVLVQLKAVGVNFIDIYQRMGSYKVSGYPYTPGKEGSGIVTEVGNSVKSFKKGDRVAFCTATTGTYAEFVTL